MLPSYVVVDLETTGGNAVHDRITEIAAVRVENGVEVARWSTLVNPGVSIPAFIQSLTGISDAMVESAPRFSDVADDLLAILKDAVFVAHNVRFDHGFILNELERIGIKLKTQTLCTVRLSRKLYPQHKGHGLDAIMRRHGLHTQARHRAMGDVDMVLQWLHLAGLELGQKAVQREAKALLQGSASVPPHLETSIGDIPNTPGVYLMFGEGPLPLYIGKSIHLRERVVSHFQSAAKVAKEMRIFQEVRRVEWRETAGELGALLLEARLVKEMQPVHNRKLRREGQLCSWQMQDDTAEKSLLELVHIGDFYVNQMPQLYGIYRSKRQAQDALREMATEQHLCLKSLGLESGKGPCFAFQIGKCRGVCSGQESGALHRARLAIALSEHRLRSWPFPGKISFREYDAARERTDIHIFAHWCHVATVHDESELEDALEARRALAFDLDTYRMLLRHVAMWKADPRHVMQLGA
jgi:DNA polymerase-3 subunit epsilon